MSLEPVGERRLAELLEDRSAAFRFQRLLDELLGDRRGALFGALAEDVVEERAADAPEVDAAVFVEAVSSIETTAFLTFGETWLELSRILFWSLVRVPSCSPLSPTTMLLREALYWAKL